MPPVLELRGITKAFPGVLANDHIDLTLEKGEIHALLGENGAGKTTLMNILYGLYQPDGGEIVVRGERITVLGTIVFNGADITHVKPSERAKRGIILCPERRRIFPESSALENLKIGGYLATRAQAQKTLDYVFTIFPALTKLKKREGGFLSGGEQQMLAIGRALMAQPKLLLLDEPLLGLSPLMEAMLARAIRDINQQTRITILISEQYARPVLPIVHHGYILENGGAVLEGSSQELMENPDVKSAYFGL